MSLKPIPVRIMLCICGHPKGLHQKDLHKKISKSCGGYKNNNICKCKIFVYHHSERLNLRAAWNKEKILHPMISHAYEKN